MYTDTVMRSSVHLEQLSPNRPPLFIIDSDGIFANEFAAIVFAEFLPVILTKKRVTKDESLRAIFIPYKSRMPRVPDNQFEAFYFVQGEEAQESLFTSLYSEAKRRKTPFFYIAQVNTLKKKTLDKLLSYAQARVFLYGELVPGSGKLTPSLQMLLQAKKQGKIILSQQGLSPVFPVTKQFVVASIVRYSLVEKYVGQCLAFLPKGDMYEISLARILKQLFPLVRIDFSVKKEHDQVFPQLPQGCLVVSEPTSSLREGIKMELKSITTKDTEADYHKEDASMRISRIVSRVFLGFVVFVLLFCFFTFGMAFFGQRILMNAMHAATSMQFAKAEQNASYARDAFAVSSGAVHLISPVATILSLQKPVSTLEKKLATGQVVASLLEQSAAAGKIYQKLFFSKDAVSKSMFVHATQVIKNNILTLSQLQAEGDIPKAYGKELAKHQKTVDLFLTATDILPDILGFEKQKKYLLLFQNNNELRPSGGFIGSYAVIAVKNGKMGKLDINDVYSADGQLTGHVEPPVPLKKYLGLTHWYLRDSNFSPDFPESAASAAFFLNLETGEKVDGVIAVDTDFLKALIAVLEPVHLPNSNIVVNENNVVKLTQEKVEKDFFAGSSQKKDFLSELLAGMRQRMQGAGREKAGQLLLAIENSLLQKHLLLAFADEEFQEPFLLQGVSSTLQTPRAAKHVVQDFFGVNEANVGTNKVNMYVNRQFSYAVTVQESGGIRVIVEETLHNTSSSTSQFGGEYKVYMRFLLPEGISPEEISIDGKKQVVLAPLADDASYAERGAVATNTLEVERIDEKGKSLYGFFLTVPPLAKKTIALSYTLHPEKLQSKGHYSLTLFKQPGTRLDPYVFSLTLPDGYALLSSTIPLKKEGKRYVFLSRLATDQVIDLSYGKK